MFWVFECIPSNSDRLLKGMLQAMAVLLYSTNAPIDRIIPRGVFPSTLLNATAGAVDGLDTAAR